MSGMVVSLLAMGVAGRELAAELEPHHMSVYRNFICIVLMLPLVTRAGWHTLRTIHLRRHILRNTIHFGAQWCWLFGLGALPLVEVFALEFTAPIWTALLASLFLSERLTGSRILAIALGFAGVLVLLRPGVAVVDPASFVVLAAAFGYAVAFVITKNLVGTDSALTVVWWMNVVQLPIGSLLSVNNLVVPSLALVPWVLLLGLGGLTSHYCLSRAFSFADVSVAMPFDYVRLPLVGVLAWWLYGEIPDLYLVAGAALIISGNWLNLRRG
jgi:drug/metabolite transporter (DMT)-like permease